MTDCDWPAESYRVGRTLAMIGRWIQSAVFVVITVPFFARRKECKFRYEGSRTGTVAVYRNAFIVTVPAPAVAAPVENADSPVFGSRAAFPSLRFFSLPSSSPSIVPILEPCARFYDGKPLRENDCIPLPWSYAFIERQFPAAPRDCAGPAQCRAVSCFRFHAWNPELRLIARLRHENSA